jgi:uncharacterized membrane protein
MNEDNQSRLNSPVVITSLVTTICFVAKEFCDYEIESDVVKAIVIVIFAAINIFAAVNNPTKKKSF